MDRVNAIINCNVMRLDRDAETIHARVGHSLRIAAKGVPSDVTGLFIRLFRPDGAYYDVPGNEHPNGIWTIYAIGTTVPSEGDSRYEIHASDAYGNPAAIARGRMKVLPFSTTGTPAEPGEVMTIAQIPTADGAMVQVRMVKDESGSWVYQAVVE